MSRCLSYFGSPQVLHRVRALRIKNSFKNQHVKITRHPNETRNDRRSKTLQHHWALRNDRTDELLFQHKSGSQRSVDRFASKEFFLHACHPFLQLHLREVTTRLASCVSFPVKLSEAKPRWVVTHVGFWWHSWVPVHSLHPDIQLSVSYQQLVVVSHRWKWPNQGRLRWVVINKPKDSSVRQNFAPGQFGHHDWENLSLADKLNAARGLPFRHPELRYIVTKIAEGVAMEVNKHRTKSNLSTILLTSSIGENQYGSSTGPCIHNSGTGLL